MSKGSKPRPHNKSKFDENFDRIFNKQKNTRSKDVFNNKRHADSCTKKDNKD